MQSLILLLRTYVVHSTRGTVIVAYTIFVGLERLKISLRR